MLVSGRVNTTTTVNDHQSDPFPSTTYESSLYQIVSKPSTATPHPATAQAYWRWWVFFQSRFFRTSATSCRTLEIHHQAGVTWSLTQPGAKNHRWWAQFFQIETRKKKLGHFPWNNGCLIEIPIMVYYNPRISGQYNPLYTLNNQGFLSIAQFALSQFIFRIPKEPCLNTATK